MLAIPNTTTGASYSSASFPSDDRGGLTPYVSGFLVVANAAAVVSVLKGANSGSASWSPDIIVAGNPSVVLPLVAGFNLSQGKYRDYIFGVRAKDLVTGVHAQVFGALFQEGEAALTAGTPFNGTVAASGTVSPGGATVQIQQSGALVGTEPILDFIGPGWGLSDDVANTRVTVTPQFQNYTPAWTSTGVAPAFGNATVIGRVLKIGTLVISYVEITFGTTTNFGSGIYLFSYPFSSAQGRVTGTADMLHVGTGQRIQGLVESQGGGASSNFDVVVPASGAIGSTSPFTWASGDILNVSLIYESQ